MRTSAGFFVTGLCGNTRVQSLPLRFRWREMRTRAASICGPVTSDDGGPAATARALDTNALGAERDGHFDGLLHGAAESDAPLELQRDVFSDERGLDLGLLHFLDV